MQIAQARARWRGLMRYLHGRLAVPRVGACQVRALQFRDGVRRKKANMTIIKQALSISAGLFVSLNLHAALLRLPAQPTPSPAIGELSVVEQTDPTPADEVSPVGTFYSAQNPGSAPLPFNLNGLPAWNLGNGIWLLDDLDSSLAAPAMMSRATSMGAPTPGGGDGGGGGDYTNNYVPYTWDTNQLWLSISNVSNGTTFASLHNGTNFVYAIESATKLPAGFQVETELFPTVNQTNVLPFTVQNLERQDLFLRAEDWTGVETNGLPCWWTWKYFGDLSETATNLDAAGNTLGDDYTNGVDPNVIQFTIEAGNDYVNIPFANLQLNLTAGKPSFYALLVNGQTTTNWLPFASTNLTVALGATDGVYTVSVSLRGLPADATQTWQDYSFTLDRVAPVLSITNPNLVSGVMATVIKPYLQLQGFADKPLASLSYDLSNALGSATNQNAFVTDQGFDTNKFDFTTNYFQAYDVPLATNGNLITLRVTDRAGNTTTTNFNVTLDYTTATNPPSVSLIWPQDGMAVSGTNLTIRGTMSDETGTIQAQIVDGDGNTNTVTGLVERNNMFWIENVPLNGTSQITLQATDAAGNVTTTNFTVNASDIQLTIDSTPTGDDLYQPTGTVYGTVSDLNATVTVNGMTVTNDFWTDGVTWYWEADNVPIYGQGTATFDASATASGQSSFSASSLRNLAQTMASSSPAPATANNSADVEFQPKLELFTYHLHTYNNTDAGAGTTLPYGDDWQKNLTNSWVRGSNDWQMVRGGTADDWSWDSDDGMNSTYNTPTNVVWETHVISHYQWNDSANGNNDSTLTRGYHNYVLDYSNLTQSVEAEIEQAPEDCGWGPEYYADGKSCDWFLNGGGDEVMVEAKAVLKLYTGGKAKVGRQNLFCLQCSGTEYKGTPWTAYGKNIPANELEALGQKVGADGKLWIMQPDNAEPLVSLTAPGRKHYYAGANQTKYKLAIQANNATLEFDKVVPAATNFWVGQYISLSPNWDLTPPYVDSVQHWSLPGNYVNEAYQYSDSCMSYRKNTDLLASNTTSCWYVRDFQAGTASVGMNLHFPNGQYASVAALGKFDMHRPQLFQKNMCDDGDPLNTITITSPSLYVSTNYVSSGYTYLYNGREVSLGDPNGGYARFWAAYQARPGDQFNYRQIFQSYRKYGTNDPVDTGSSWKNDGAGNKTGGIQFAGQNGLGEAQQTDKYPGVPMIGPEAKVNDIFKTYMQYTPQEAGSISVTLGLVNWSWAVDAQYANGVWNVPPGTISPPQYHDDDSFPLWNY
jgi:hypothetical protein